MLKKYNLRPPPNKISVSSLTKKLVDLELALLHRIRVSVRIRVRFRARIKARARVRDKLPHQLSHNSA